MTPVPTQDPWRDQFSTPTVESLLAAIPEERAGPIRSLIERLDGSRGEGPGLEVRWCGVPWRWAIVLGEAGPTDPHVIPDPGGPSATIGVLASELEQVDLKKLRRATRETLAAGKSVRDRLWVELPLDAEDASGDFMRLLAPRLPDQAAEPTPKKRSRSSAKPKA